MGGGYGKMYWNGRGKPAHRIAWELTNGPIPKGLICRHRCDNPPCCNPAHLEIGTYHDNNMDMLKRERNHPRKGEQHGQAKLNKRQVTEIRRLYASGGTSQRKIARMFNVSQSLIGRIVRSEYWQSI